MKKIMLSAMGALVLGGAVASAQAGEYLREVPYVPGQPMPEGAGPGEAWCLFQYPAVTETIVEEVVVRPATPIVKPVPPEFGKKTESFVCEEAYEVGQATAMQMGQSKRVAYEYRPAYKATKVTPATFKTIQEEVVVCEGYTEEYWEPTQFKTEQVSFVICPERNELQQVQCIDGTNMDCYVTVRIPAQVQSAQVKRVAVPGKKGVRTVPPKMGVIQKCVIDQEERIDTVVVQAESRTYDVGVPVGGRVNVVAVPERKATVTSVTVIREASTQEVMLPEVKQKVQKTVVKTPSRIVWRLQRVNVAAPAPAPAVEVAADDYADYDGAVPGSTPTYRRFR